MKKKCFEFSSDGFTIIKNILSIEEIDNTVDEINRVFKQLKIVVDKFPNG